MAPKTDRMYAKGRTIGKDEEGNPKVVDVDKSAGNSSEGTEMNAGAATPIMARHAHERMEMHHKHIGEHLAMHRKHEMEHATHAGGDKKSMHERHEVQMEGLHKRAEGEMKDMHDRHEREKD